LFKLMYMYLLRVNEATSLKGSDIWLSHSEGKPLARLYVQGKTQVRGKQPQWVQLSQMTKPFDPHQMAADLKAQTEPEKLVFSKNGRKILTSSVNAYLKKVMPLFAETTLGSDNPVVLEPNKRWSSHMWRASGICALFSADICVQLIAEHSRHSSETLLHYIRKQRPAHMVKLSGLWEKHCKQHPTLRRKCPKIGNTFGNLNIMHPISAGFG